MKKIIETITAWKVANKIGDIVLFCIMTFLMLIGMILVIFDDITTDMRFIGIGFMILAIFYQNLYIAEIQDRK